LIGSKNIDEVGETDTMTPNAVPYPPIPEDYIMKYPDPSSETIKKSSFLSETDRDETFITSNTVIHGSISTKSNIKISGYVKGDISSEKDIYVTGKIEGNIKGNMVNINSGVIQGNILAAADVSLNSEAVVVGDMQANNFDSDGKIKGNIKAGNSVSLKTNSVVYGNISSKNINIQDGAAISGNVEIISDTKRDDSLFSVDLSAATKD